MHAILVDDNGDSEQVVVHPEDKIIVMDYYFPCGYCGKATLISKAMGIDHDMCRKCYKD